MPTKSSRREFLSTAAKVAAGAGLGAAGANLITTQQGRAAPAVPAWPYGYKKLDPEAVRKAAHKWFWDQGRGCSYGAFKGIVETLAEKGLTAYKQVPAEMLIYGAGGMVGWGTFCGALNGAAAAINLIVDKPTADKVIGELVGWYTTAPFPSNESNALAQTHGFAVEKIAKALPQSVAGSPQCHVSVTRWVENSGYKASTIERSERCARLAGDVAAHTVELLNAVADGTFKAEFVLASPMVACVGCHGAGSKQDNVRTKMDCTQCHETNWKHP